MSENVKKAMEFISNNEDLKKRLEALCKEYGSLEEINLAIIEIMKEYGFELTMEELMPKAEVTTDTSEISDDELEAVAGGKMVYDWGSEWWYSDCHCSVAGAGSKDKYQRGCICIACGGGLLNDVGKRAFETEVAFYCISSGNSYAMNDKAGL